MPAGNRYAARTVPNHELSRGHRYAVNLLLVEPSCNTMTLLAVVVQVSTVW